jgi:hypothetical protein
MPGYPDLKTDTHSETLRWTLSGNNTCSANIYGMPWYSNESQKTFLKVRVMQMFAKMFAVHNFTI